MNRSLFYFCLIFASVGGMFAQHQPEKLKIPGSDVQNLIGTWRVVEVADVDKGGKWEHFFGEPPRGYFVYDATGHVHIQIMKVPPLKPFPEANTDEGKPPTAEHALAAYNSFFAYFGTYTVDAEKHVVTHHVEGSFTQITLEPKDRARSSCKATVWSLVMARLGGLYWSVCTDITDAERRPLWA